MRGLAGGTALFFWRPRLGLLSPRRTDRASASAGCAEIQVWPEGIAWKTFRAAHGTRLLRIPGAAPHRRDRSCAAPPETAAVAGLQSICIAGARSKPPFRNSVGPIH